MRNIGTFLLVVMCTFLLVGNVQAIDKDPISGKVFGGYCIVFNAETGDGFVYANRDRCSLLVVFYPSGNRAYTYSSGGQGVHFADDIGEIIIKFGISLNNIKSIIKPLP